MDAATMNRVEQYLRNDLRNQLNTALRVDLSDRVVALDIVVHVKRIEGVGLEANYPFDVQTEFTWTWNRN